MHTHRHMHACVWEWSTFITQKGDKTIASERIYSHSFFFFFEKLLVLEYWSYYIKLV